MKKYFSFLTSQISTQGGFTLLELLVVISIIGILTALGAVNYVGVRERARDAERKADLSQIQTALEFYRSDTGEYPTRTLFYSNIACNGEFANNGVVYIKSVPCDPSTGAKYNYNRQSLYTYTVSVCLENADDSQGSTDTTCPGGALYSVQNP